MKFMLDKFAEAGTFDVCGGPGHFGWAFIGKGHMCRVLGNGHRELWGKF